MKIHRFIGDFDLSQQEVEITSPKNTQYIKQIKDVLRLGKGDTIILSDGEGRSAEVMLVLVSAKKIIGEIQKIEKSEEMQRTVRLYLAILKKENFELAVQKAVEVGVSGIVPVITERTIKTGLNFDRLNKITIEASEQSGRSIVPTLSPILDFKDALIDGIKTPTHNRVGVPTKSVGIIFHLIGEPYVPNKNAKSVSIFIGPEGGFTEPEINMARDYGYTVASLGPLTLRGETAAIVATYRAVSGI